MARGPRQGPARRPATSPGRLPDPAHRPRPRLRHRPRKRARRGGAGLARHRRHRLAVHRPVRHGLGHHARLPVDRHPEEHHPGRGRPLDRPGPVRHRHRPGRRHPGLHRLQQVLDRRGQVRRPPGGLRRRPGRPPSSGGWPSGPEAMALSANDAFAAGRRRGRGAARPPRRALGDQRHARWST